MKNRTLVVDLTHHINELAPAIIGAAKANGVPYYWGTDAVLLALNPAVGAHRAMEAELRATPLVIHVR
jgi:hypothetical protein